MKSVTVLLLNRRNSWPTQPIGCKKGHQKKAAYVTVLGQVESEGDSIET